MQNIQAKTDVYANDVPHVERAAKAHSPARSGLGTGAFEWTHQALREAEVFVEGKLPSWLSGRLMRTAPAVFERGAWRAAHWFDGLGMLYAFELGEKGVSFKQHLLETAFTRDLDAGRAAIATFATPTQRSLWQRLLSPVPEVTDNTNVNVVPWQGAWLAMTEGPHPLLIDHDLNARPYTYDDRLPAALSMTAHPHFDFAQDAMVNVGQTFGPKNELWVVRQAKHSRKRVVEGRLALKRLPYVHSFGLTSRHAVLIDHPYEVNPLRLLLSNRPFIEALRWKPERGTLFRVLDRASGSWRAYEADALFCFHTVNTFEDGDDLVIDFVAFDDPGVLERLRREALNTAVPDVAPRFLRARITPNSRQAKLTQLSEQGFEFPNISYRRDHGQPYRTVWGAALQGQPAAQFSSSLVRVNVEDGCAVSFNEPGVTYGEPVFVPRPGAARSDDGVLLTVGGHSDAERTTLLVLDATRMEPLARASVDLKLPLGLHGNFAQAR